jgi:Phage derived protein Gp49-like (DUF891)
MLTSGYYSMRRILLIAGQRFNVYAIVVGQGEDSHCPANDFIEQMSEPSRKSMLNVMKQHAMAGPLLNEQKSRSLRDGILEFKSRQGDRLLWFYPPGARGETIITHGFHKGAPLTAEIERAKRLRDQYLSEE